MSNVRVGILREMCGDARRICGKAVFLEIFPLSDIAFLSVPISHFENHSVK